MLNLANLLTLSRFMAIPLMTFVALSPNYNSVWLGIIFGIAAMTDWLDGFVARSTGTVTEFGKTADPLADRLLIITAVVILYVKAGHAVPLWAVFVIVLRDVALLIGSGVLLARGIKLKITGLGKAATACLMASLFGILIGGDLDWPAAINVLSLVVFYAGVTLSVVSGLSYLRWGKISLRSITNK